MPKSSTLNSKAKVKSQLSTILSQIAQQLQENTPLTEILQGIANSLHDALGLDRCIITEMNAEGDMQITYVSMQTAERQQILENHLCPCTVYHKEILNKGKAIVCHNLESIKPLELQELARQHHFHAIAMIPIYYQKKLLGGFCLQHCNQSHEWTTAELDLVKTVANQCAVALTQDKLSQLIQQGKKQDALLQQIVAALNSGLDAEAILQTILKLVGESMAVERVIIFRVSADMISVRQEWRVNEQIPSLIGQEISTPEWLELLPSADQHDSYTSNLLQGNTQMIEEFALSSQEVKSSLNIPIMIQKRFFGGLSLQTVTSDRIFEESDVKILKNTADYTAIALDIAQREEQTRQLRKEKQQTLSTNRAKAEFLSTMNHELKTPLTSIVSFARMLQGQIYGPLNDKQREYVNVIHNSGENLLSLLGDLLDLSLIEANWEGLVLETILIKEVCLEALTLIPGSIQKPNLQIGLEIDSDLTFCIADKKRLKQILVNLLSNAVKFTEEGFVKLKVYPEKDMICFSVIDTGIGISPEEQEKLFQPLQQLKKPFHALKSGTGLGLVLSQKLAYLHGGNLTVTSEVGAGSCFTLHLPAMETIG